MDIPAAQRKAHESSTLVEYTSKLDIYSNANRSVSNPFIMKINIPAAQTKVQ
jgi:hypothetical protein